MRTRTWRPPSPRRISAVVVSAISRPADDDEPVRGLLHLAHQVAGDQDVRPSSASRRSRSADPAHAVEVEPVDRLVEEHDARIAEQGRGDPEPLAHAERVALDPPRAAPSSPTSSMTSSTRRSPMPLVRAAMRRWLRPVRPGGPSPGRAGHRPPAAARRTTRTAGRARAPARASAGPARAPSASWWTCRPRWDRGTRSPAPARRRSSGRPRRPRRRTSSSVPGPRSQLPPPLVNTSLRR